LTIFKGLMVGVISVVVVAPVRASTMGFSMLRPTGGHSITVEGKRGVQILAEDDFFSRDVHRTSDIGERGDDRDDDDRDHHDRDGDRDWDHDHHHHHRRHHHHRHHHSGDHDHDGDDDGGGHGDW
jgi:hypothetical protein